jgi:PIN domain nuclease of toxin-antitoxin system
MVLLDTHAVLWYYDNPSRLSKKSLNAIKTSSVLAISTISAWEVSMLVQKGRLSLKYDVNQWVSYVSETPLIQWIDISSTIAVKSSTLPGRFHQDPADRFIVATALLYGIPIITRDKSIQNYIHVETIW